MIELALYQPDIPQNTGTLLRLCACWDIRMHLIEPLGFVFDTHKLRRSGMDYIDHVDYMRHENFDTFLAYVQKNNQRLVLSTTQGATNLQDFQFDLHDMILMGRETAGVPKNIHDQIQSRVRIPMKENMRSINMAISAAVMLAQAMGQNQSWDAL